MRRSTTPFQQFDLGIDTEMIRKITITYCQDDVIVLQKHEGDMQMKGTKVSYELTEAEVNLFDNSRDASPVEIQAAFLTNAGKKAQTKIVRVPVLRVLDDTIMGGESDGN